MNTCGFIESAKEESVDGHRRARRAEAGGALQEARRDGLPRAAPRRRARRASCRRWTTSSAPAPTPDVAPDRLRRAGEAARRPRPRLRPLGRDAAGELAPVAHRLPQDLRGLRQRLRLLHHPEAARAAALAPGRRRRRGGGGARASRARSSSRSSRRTSPPTGTTSPAGRGCTSSCRALARVDGIRWIRLHYAYPRDVPDALVETIADEPKIVKYLDMPLQHSSDRLLPRDEARARLGVPARAARAPPRARAGARRCAPRSSSACPGETEEDFEELVRFVEEQRFERLGVFEYSRRGGHARRRDGAAGAGEGEARPLRAGDGAAAGDLRGRTSAR